MSARACQDAIFNISAVASAPLQTRRAVGISSSMSKTPQLFIYVDHGTKGKGHIRGGAEEKRGVFEADPL